MAKVIVIKKCSSCPYFKHKGKPICNVTFWETIDMQNKFPEWCPLLDIDDDVIYKYEKAKNTEE